MIGKTLGHYEITSQLGKSKIGQCEARTMRTKTAVSLIILLLLSVLLFSADSKSSQNIAYNFTKIAEGVYFATGNGKMAGLCNSVVIINGNEVILVDSSTSPAAARALIADVKTLTREPVRYVINTHFHFDHAHGNQVFGPEVEIIGHEYTREQLMGDVLHSKTYLAFTGGLPQRIEALQKQIAAETDAKKKGELKNDLALAGDYYRTQAKIIPTPPNVTFKDRLSLFRGSREIRLLFLGMGHTGGDVFVYLPKEKILCTGDFLCPFLSYMGDGYVDEWDDTLEKLKSIDFDVILPGHGDPMRTGEKIGHFQAYLRDLWQRTVALRNKGYSADEVAEKIDLTDHVKNYPQITGPGADKLAIERIYQLLELREKSRSFIGTWKLNAAKSKVGDPSAMPKNETWGIVAQQEGIKTTFDGVSAQGREYHIESSGKWDGKYVPVTGDPNAEAFAIKKIDSNTMEFVVKKKPGKLAEPWRVTVSKDGKTMTSVGKVKRANGQEISGTYVYDRQESGDQQQDDGSETRF